MTDQEKMQAIIAMIEMYRVEVKGMVENAEDYATQSFDKLERFIQENSNTVVLIPFYRSEKDFIEAMDRKSS